jgi:hypothetical protein
MQMFFLAPDAVARNEQRIGEFEEKGGGISAQRPALATQPVRLIDRALRNISRK